MSVLPFLAGESWARETGVRDEDVDVEENRKTCIVMLGLGIAQSIGSWIIGRVVTRLGQRTVVHLNFASCIVALGVAAYVTKSFYVL